MSEGEGESRRRVSSLREVLLFVVFVAVLACVFILPNVNRQSYSPVRTCIVNLKQIDGAVQQWALNFKRTPADTYSLEDTTLLAFIKGSVLPQCPAGGRYTAGTNIADWPKCNIPGHTL